MYISEFNVNCMCELMCSTCFHIAMQVHMAQIITPAICLKIVNLHNPGFDSSQLVLTHTYLFDVNW